MIFASKTSLKLMIMGVLASLISPMSFSQNQIRLDDVEIRGERHKQNLLLGPRQRHSPQRFLTVRESFLHESEAGRILNPSRELRSERAKSPLK